MESNFGQAQYINPGSINAPYTVLTLEGRNYRVLSRQYRYMYESSKLWSVFWYLLGAFMLGSGIALIFESKVYIILITAFGSILLFAIYVWTKRRQLTDTILYCSINLLIVMAPIIMLAILQIKQMLVPLSLYIIIQMIISFKLMKNKSQIFAKFLILIEATLIVLKVDQKIKILWRDVFFTHIVFFFFLSFCIAFMTVYLVYMKFTQPNLQLIKYKLPGALFVYFNTIAFALLTATPILYIFLNINLWIICFSLFVVFAAQGTYSLFYRKEISIFFCDLNEIKSFDQVIFFEPIEEIQQLEEESIKKIKKQKKQPLYLFRISQNWLTKDPSKASLKESESQTILNLNPQICDESKKSDTKMTDCIICMDCIAQVVWMPCGHLTVCKKCSFSMFESKNFNCVLCKKTPEQVFIIDSKSSKDRSQTTQKNQNIQLSFGKDDSSILSEAVILNNEKKASGKQKLQQSIQNQLQHKKLQPNRKAFRIIEGYNVKII